MFESALKELIPKKVQTFAKLKSGELYHFDRWDVDKTGSSCLYYWFLGQDGMKKYVKRVLISEIRDALNHLICHGRLSRKEYKKVCPKTESAGSCGFAIVGRILEAMNVAEYSVYGKFKLTDIENAKRKFN